MRTPFARTTLLAFAFAAVLTPVAASAAPSDTLDLTGREYVALGDSYSAGFGLFPYSDQPASGCFQADENYPHRVAARFGLALDDRTCSGATTLNITTTPQATITGAGVAPLQIDALTPETDIVTVTIGGNDLGFADVAEACIARSATGPLLWNVEGIGYQNCREIFVRDAAGYEVDLLADRIAFDVAPRLHATFALIAQRAPSAKVFVIGYPTISPNAENVPAGGCYRSPLGPSGLLPPFPQNSFPFTDVDTLYLHQTEVRLDAAIQNAAQVNGATYLSTLTATQANSACAPDGRAFVNGITITNSGTPANSTPIPDTGYGVVLGALHPNEAGVQFLSDQVVAAISEAFAAEPGIAAPAPAPAPSSIASAAPAAVVPATADRLAESGGAPGWVLAGFAAVFAAAGLALFARARRTR